MNNTQKLHSLLLASACMTLPLFAQSPSRPPLGPLVFTGIVLDGVTGAPIADAVVSGQSHIVKTDSSGRFVIPDAVAGEISTYKNGYFWPEDIGACCSRHNVLFGEQPREFHFTLMPMAKLSGRVSLPSGVPIASLQMTLLRQQVSNDGQLVWNISNRVQTTADGSYNISSLMPGTYQLRSEDLNPMRSETGRPLHPDADHSIGLPRTSLPLPLRADTSNQPQLLTLHAGDDKTADLLVSPAPFRAVTIHLGQSAPGPIGYSLHRVDGAEDPLSQASASSGNDPLLTAAANKPRLNDAVYSKGHSPTRTNVALDFAKDPAPAPGTDQLHLYAAPGRYRIDYVLYPFRDPQTNVVTAWSDGSTDSFFGSAAFEVRDQPLQLNGSEMEHAHSISVHIVQHGLESSAPQPSPSAPATLHVTDERQGWHNATFNPALEDQSITLPPIEPGEYRIAFPPDFYTASLTCGSADLLRAPLELHGDQSTCTIEAVIGKDFGTLAVALDAIGTASLKLGPEEHIAVLPSLFAVTSGGRLRRVLNNPNSPHFEGDTASITFHSLAPGLYLVAPYPLDQTLLSRAFNEPSTASQLHRAGTLIEVMPNQQATVQLHGSLRPRH